MDSAIDLELGDHFVFTLRMAITIYVHIMVYARAD